MSEYILVTVNNSTIRSEMDSYTSIELVASEENFICWHWVNPSPTDLSAAQALTGYVGTVQIS